ncbi:hypothetical protein B484DRAFT_183016 [Ochromonadaceae sp. CCMP2298]|nr:hypothetical protein B484DRAFT_183016 [Ochromonadaceae sp. CCMP2298]
MAGSPSSPSSEPLTATAEVVLVVTDAQHTPYVLLPGMTTVPHPCNSQDGQLGEYQEIRVTPRQQQCERITGVDVLHVTEDTPTIIHNVTVGDADEAYREFLMADYQLNLSCTHGLLALPDALKYGVRVTVLRGSGGSGSGSGEGGGQRLSVVGLLHNLNAALNTFTYTPPLDYYGPDAISVYVNDQPYGSGGSGGGKSTNETIPVYVDSVVDPPLISVLLFNSTTQSYEAGGGLSVLEDQRIAIVGVNITDPDFFEFASTPPTYLRDRVTHQPFEKASNSWDLDMHRTTQDRGLLRLSVSSNHGRVMFASTVGVALLGVPGAETETERLSQYPNVVTSFTNRNIYTGAEGTLGGGAFSFDSALDSAQDPAANVGADSSGTTRQVWWTRVTLQGSLFDLNRALAVVTYWPDLNWNSGASQCRVEGGIVCVGAEVDLLTFTVSSALNTSLQDTHTSTQTSSSAPASSGTIPIHVVAQNDAPVLHFAHAIYSTHLVTEDLLFAQVADLTTQYTLEDTPITLGQISVFDVDSGRGSFLRVNLTCVHGSVTVRALNPLLNNTLSADRGTVGLHFEAGGGVDDVVCVFSAPLGVLNAALAAVIFTPAPNYSGLGARLTVTVDDMHAGGAKQDSRTFRIIVQPANDPPTIRLPSEDGGKSIFLLDEGAFVRIQGAQYQPLPLDLLEGGDYRINTSSANMFQSGYEPWRFHEPLVYSTRGTFGAGRLDWASRQVGDINPGPPSSNPRFFTTYRDQIYFQADDGQHGAELWRDYGLLQTGSRANDGSHVGDATATLFLDLLPGSRGSSPAHLTVHSSYLYFTAEGTDTSWMVLGKNRDACGSFRQSSFDSRVAFAVAQETAWLPQRVYDCPQGYHWASTEEGYRYFTSYAESTLERFWHR